MSNTPRTTSIVITDSQRAALDSARERLAIGGSPPSMAAIIRAAIDRGLPLVAPPPSPKGA